MKSRKQIKKYITCHRYCHPTSAVENLLLEIFALLRCYAAPINCPETSESNYQYMLCNVAEERRPHLHRSGSLNSHTFLIPTKHKHKHKHSRSQWPCGLRRRSAVARLLWSWVRIPPWAWMLFCCECCVLSGRGLCDELITRPEESYRLWCVVVCDPETSWMRRPWPTGGCCAKTINNKHKHKHTTTHTLVYLVYFF